VASGLEVLAREIVTKEALLVARPQPLRPERREIAVHHSDVHSQAMSKIERGFADDPDDADVMLREGLVVAERAHGAVH